MNKKGSLLDVPIILVVLFIAALFVIVVLKIVISLTDSLATSESIRPETQASMLEAKAQIPKVFDFLFLILFIGLPLFSCFLAFFNNIHPMLFYASIGLVVIIVVMGATIGDVWERASSSEGFGDMARSLPMTDYILNNMAVYAFLVFLLISGATWIRIQQPIQ
jgi:hypothetical protein